MHDEEMSTSDTLKALSEMVAVVIANENGDMNEAMSLIQDFTRMLSDSLIVEFFRADGQTLN